MLLIKPEVSNRSSGCFDTEKNAPLRRDFLQDNTKSATQRETAETRTETSFETIRKKEVTFGCFSK
jgi:hypothetical protein